MASRLRGNSAARERTGWTALDQPWRRTARNGRDAGNDFLERNGTI